MRPSAPAALRRLVLYCTRYAHHVNISSFEVYLWPSVSSIRWYCCADAPVSLDNSLAARRQQYSTLTLTDTDALQTAVKAKPTSAVTSGDGISSFTAISHHYRPIQEDALKSSSSIIIIILIVFSHQ